MFRAREFLQSTFGPPDRVVAAFESYGLVPPTLFAIEKWQQRGSIPPRWLIDMLVIAEFEAGQPVRLVHYVDWASHGRT